jgi:type I restriction enzyme S subunit
MSSSADNPTQWPVLPLEQCVDILDHLRQPLNARERAARRGSVPYYGTTGLIDHIDSHIFDEELVLLGEDAAPFFDKTRQIAYVISGPAWVNNHAHVLRPRRNVLNADYLKYYLDHFDFSGRVLGSTRDKLTQRAMRSIPVLVPSLSEQAQIASALKRCDTLVTACTGSLASARAQLYDFEAAVLTAACSGKLTALWRNSNIEAAESPIHAGGDISEQFRQLFVEMQQQVAAPTLPGSYRVVQLGDVAEAIDYGTSKKAAPTGDLPVLRMGNIQNGRLQLDDIKYVSHEDVPDNLLLSTDDLLFNRTNSPELVGKSAVYDLKDRTTFASYLLRVRLDTDRANPHYVAIWLNSNWGRAWAQRVKVDGVGQSNINSTKLRSMPLVLPPPAEQHEIVQVVGRLLSVSAEAQRRSLEVDGEAKSARLNALRMAFNGQLSEPEVLDTGDGVANEESGAPETGGGAARAGRRAPKEVSVKRGRKRRDLADVLAENGSPMTVKELFGAAGFTHANIESFYLALRDAQDAALLVERRLEDGEPILILQPASDRHENP